MTVRKRAWKEIEKHPENLDSISHNLSVALMQLGVPSPAWVATMDELHRRWEFSIMKKDRKRQS